MDLNDRMGGLVMVSGGSLMDNRERRSGADEAGLLPLSAHSSISLKADQPTPTYRSAFKLNRTNNFY
jgi:hypothetical protein